MPKLPTLDAMDGVTCASLCDALAARYGHRGHILGLVSPSPQRRLWGPVVTIDHVPMREDVYEKERHNFARLFYEAVGDAPTGRVLVLGNRGDRETALGGGAKLSRVRNHGLAGVLADGRLRDFDELAGYGFAAWCRGETVKASGKALMPWAANVPVVVQGVTILPGDVVYADATGAVVLPGASAAELVEAARGIEEADRRVLGEIAQEDPEVVRRRGSAK